MWVYNWIKSFFISPPETIEKKILDVDLDPPYSLLYQPTLTINQVEEIQNTIEKYFKIYDEENPDYHNIQDAYNELISISSLDENVRLYLHELMLFSSIRIERTPLYVELSKMILNNYPHLQSYLESQIFWCFNNCADLFVYESIEKGLLKEAQNQIFEKSILLEFNFYEYTDNNYSPFLRYFRHLHLMNCKGSEFDQSSLESFFKKYKSVLNDPEYPQKMRICLNNDQIAKFIRNDKSELIGTDNGEFEPNIIDRNELLCFGCDFLEYSAFYGSKNCFLKISGHNSIKNRTSNKKRFTLCDFAACGGSIEICKEILKEGLHFTSQSLRLSIRYHRYQVFEWLTKELNIKMDDDCYKDSFLYEFIPGIEMYEQLKKGKVNINLEVSKSGNYVLFTKFVNLDCMENNKKRFYRYKYAPIMPIFMYNSIDCYRYFFTLQLDLNECSWFDNLYSTQIYGNTFVQIINDQQYRNPFHIAIDHQFIDLIKMILKFGIIDVNKQERIITSGGYGTLSFSKSLTMAPIEIAIKTDNPNILDFLLSIDEIDVNVMSRNSGGSSYSMGRGYSYCEMPILKVAAIHGNLEMLEVLLKSPRIDKKMKCHINAEGYGYSSDINKDEYESITKDIRDQKVIDLFAKYGIK